MRVKIERFCKYSSYEIIFNEFKTCLFQGASGEGKTTLFEAIRFCLYGNNSNIYPSGDPSTAKRKTKVTLEIPEYSDLVISRSKPPEILTVSVSGVELESEAAQEYINNLFGNYFMFIATTYLAQGQRHPLISLSNKEKFDLLSLLTFGLDNEEHPDTFINTIDINIKEIDKKLEKKILEREYNLQKLKGDFSETSVEEIEKLDENLRGIISEIEGNNLIWEKTLQNETLRDNLKSQLKTINKKLSLIERDISLESLSETQTKKLKEYLNLPVLIKVEKVKDFNKDFSLAEIENLIDQVTTKNKILKKISMLEVFEYSLEEIQSMKEYLKLKEKLIIPKREIDIEVLKYDLETLKNAKSLLKSLPAIYYKLNPDLKDDYLEYLRASKEKPQKWLEPELGSSEYQNQISLLEEKEKEDKICERYKVSKDKSKISDSIKIIEKHLNSQVMYSEYKKLNEKISLANSELTKNLEKVEKLKSQYSGKAEEYQVFDLDDLKQRTGKGYTCPKCHESLLMKNNSLVTCHATAIPENISISLEKYFKKTKSKENKIQKYSEDLEKFKSEQNSLEDGPIYENPTKIMKMLQDLKSLKFIDFEGDMKTLKILYECSQYKEKYSHLEEPPAEVLADTHNIKNLNLYSDIQKNLLGYELNFKETEEMISLHEEYKLQETYKIILSEMKKYKNTELDFSELKILEKKIIQQEGVEKMLNQELSKIEINTTMNLEELHRYKEKILLQERYLNYKKLKCNHQNILNELDFEYSGITLEKLNKYLKNKPILEMLISEKEDVTENYKKIKIETPSPQLKEEKTKLEDEKTKLISNIKESKVCLLIQDQNKYIKRSQQKKLSLEKIKSLAIQARGQTLQHFVNNLNISINKILAELFEDPIQVKLQLEKQNKSNDKTRSVVNFIIEYRGYQFDSPSSLSGGERDRLSLALMISLASVCGSKFVLLDECLASLNEELRLICIQTLNKYLPGKTVINVCHSVTEGFHDETVNIR